MIYKQVGRYIIIELLGRGAMGEVYRAHDPDLDREVALKLITLPDQASSDEWRRRFRREVQAAARLNHPHIVTIYDVDLEHDPPYVVMESLTGGTLQEQLAQKPLPWQEALELLHPLCQALAYAHQAAMIHRDVKPANVMFTGDDPLLPSQAPPEPGRRRGSRRILKLVDFGLARWEGGEQVTQTGGVVGTPAYMAPEQAKAEVVDARTDIYSLGIILFEAIVGHNPQDKATISQTWAAATSYEPIDLEPLVGRAPPPLVKVIRRALEKDRGQRYHDCETLCRDLAGCQDQSAYALETSSPPFAIPPALADSGPRIENPRELSLPPQAEDILKTMFATYRRVAVGEEFGGGLSGSRVFLVHPVRDDGTSELPAVIKMAPIGLIQKEWQAYQDCMRDQWPGVVEIRGEPILPLGYTWGGLRYPLTGGGAFEIESLYRYCRHAPLEDIRYVLEERLFRVIKQTWQFSRRTPAFNLRASYDSLLPVNLLIKPVTPPPDTLIRLLKPGASTGQPPERGDYVRLEGFVITEVDLPQGAVTLNLPPLPDDRAASYRLRLQPVERTRPYQVNRIVDPIQGVVTATRHDLLQAQAQQSLGQPFDLATDTLTLPDGTTLLNPLVALPAMLGELRNVKVACIHGDLNLENILVDPATRDVSLIDFAAARRDHVLHDLLRLETEVVTKLFPEALVEAGLPPETIYLVYEQLHRAAFLPRRFESPASSHPALEKPFAMLVAIRKMARDCLFSRDDWAEYYQGLTFYLLGALKFKNLDKAPEAPLPKQVAFWGAATLASFLERPLPPLPVPGEPILESREIPLKMKRLTWVAGMLIAVALVVVAVLIVQMVDGIGDGTGGPPAASIIGVQAEVDIRRKDTDRLIPATFGLVLYQGDVVNAYLDASATIICENGLVFELPEQSNLTIDCQDETHERIVGRLDSTLSHRLVGDVETIPVALGSTETRASRSGQELMPLLLSPRNTLVADTHPTFHWQPAAGASGYRLALSLPGGEMWSRETNATSLPYPAGVPPLEPGSANIVILAALDDTGNETAIDRTLLRVLDEAGRAELNRDEAAIQALELDEVARGYLLAKLYREQGMWDAAVTQLEQLTESERAPSANLWQQLGDLYFEVGLYAQAEEPYRAALAAAEASQDRSAQAAAHIGLARIAHVFRETEQASECLEIAEKLYRQAGQRERAEQVAEERARLEP